MLPATHTYIVTLNKQLKYRTALDKKIYIVATNNGSNVNPLQFIFRRNWQQKSGLVVPLAISPLKCLDESCF